MIPIITTMKTTPNADAPQNNAFSPKVRRMLLGLDLHSWETGMLISLALAGVVAFAVFAATGAVVLLTRAANEDLKIELAAANDSAAKANERASKADERAAESGVEAAKANERAAALEKEAEQAKSNAAFMMNEASRASHMAADATMRAQRLAVETEGLRAENLKLAAQIAPRQLAPDDVPTMVLALSKFRGETVRLRSYALDVDAARLGEQFRMVLNSAGIGVENSLLREGAIGSVTWAIYVYGDNEDLVAMLMTVLSDIGKFPFVTKGTPPPGGGIAGVDSPEPVAATVFFGVKPPPQ